MCIPAGLWRAGWAIVQKNARKSPTSSLQQGWGLFLQVRKLHVVFRRGPGGQGARAADTGKGRALPSCYPAPGLRLRGGGQLSPEPGRLLEDHLCAGHCGAPGPSRAEPQRIGVGGFYEEEALASGAEWGVSGALGRPRLVLEPQSPGRRYCWAET